MILTARKVFLILTFSFNLVHLPFITAMFSFLIVWSVLGKGWAIAVWVITSIPDWISSLYQAIFLGNPAINLVQSSSRIVLPLPPFQIPSWAVIVMSLLYIVGLVIMAYTSVRRIIRIKNRIRKTISGLYGFKSFRKTEDSNP